MNSWDNWKSGQPQFETHGMIFQGQIQGAAPVETLVKLMIAKPIFYIILMKHLFAYNS